MGEVVATWRGQPAVAGLAEGIALVTSEPLSFWGGVDPNTGEVIDRRHPLSGQILAGRVLVLPHGRGSCSASGVLLEAIRNGVGPAGLITSRMDPILGLGAILAEELYGRVVPIIVLAERDWSCIRTGDSVAIGVGGDVESRSFAVAPLGSASVGTDD